MCRPSFFKLTALSRLNSCEVSTTDWLTIHCTNSSAAREQFPLCLSNTSKRHTECADILPHSLTSSALYIKVRCQIHAPAILLLGRDIKEGIAEEAAWPPARLRKWWLKGKSLLLRKSSPGRNFANNQGKP